MSLKQDIDALQRQLHQLATGKDDELIERYALQRPPRPPGLYWQMRWLAGWVLRWLESMRVLRPDPWPVGLKHAHANAKARPLLIWALGTDRDTLRAACKGFARLQESLPEFAPVLVTDVADFAYFSRLGWLVEFLPRLSGQGEPYSERKMRYLARLYNGAPALPFSAGLEADSQADIIRQILMRGASS